MADEITSGLYTKLEGDFSAIRNRANSIAAGVRQSKLKTDILSIATRAQTGLDRLRASTIIQDATSPTPTSLALRAPDGGTNYYSQFSNGFPTDSSFFPVGVWLQSIGDQQSFDKDRELGINTYVLAAAPEVSDDWFDDMRAANMHAILQQNELHRFTGIGTETKAYGLNDEEDMAENGELAYQRLEAQKALLPQDGRMVFSNFGKGCLFWQSDVDAKRHPAVVDLTSADAYFFSDLDCRLESQGGKLLGLNRDLTVDEAERASNYGLIVERMRFLTDYNKPIWGVVETSYAGTNAHRKPTPEQVVAALWHCIISGARGIILFVHSFGGGAGEVSSDSLDLAVNANTRAAVQAATARMRDLAPVLNAPTILTSHTISSNVKASVRYLALNGKTYVIAGNVGTASVTGSFTLPWIGNTPVTVLGENRTLTAVNGTFTDNFADGNAIHIYQTG